MQHNLLYTNILKKSDPGALLIKRPCFSQPNLLFIHNRDSQHMLLSNPERQCGLALWRGVFSRYLISQNSALNSCRFDFAGKVVTLN